MYSPNYLETRSELITMKRAHTQCCIKIPVIHEDSTVKGKFYFSYIVPGFPEIVFILFACMLNNDTKIAYNVDHVNGNARYGSFRFRLSFDFLSAKRD